MPSGRVVDIRRKGRTCCPSCQELWAGDSRVRILSNLIDGYRGRVVLVTITAPGQDVLPWDDGQVREDAAHAWNVCAPAQWSHLNRRVRIRMTREGGPRPPKLLAYVWAYQRRGVLHLHLVLAGETDLDRIAAKRYVRHLKGGMAAEWGFGFVDLKPPKHSGPKGLAAYLAKYVCKTSDSGRPELAETVAHADVPKRPIYISRDLTSITRCTMRNLRLRRYYWQASTCRQPGVMACWLAEDMWDRGIKVRNGALYRAARGP